MVFPAPTKPVKTVIGIGIKRIYDEAREKEEEKEVVLKREDTFGNMRQTGANNISRPLFSSLVHAAHSLSSSLERSSATVAEENKPWPTQAGPI